MIALQYSVNVYGPSQDQASNASGNKLQIKLQNVLGGDAVTAGLLRIGAFRTDPDHEAAVGRMQAWTRERFELPEQAAVMVTELACRRPGCPPLETVVAFWEADNQRRHFKVFKPIADVTANDLPPAWLRDALCAEPEDDFACC